MHQVPTQCPVCRDELRVVRLQCDGCGTAIEGQFALGRWLRLSPEQLAFANVFLKRRGKIKDVEDELGISYPTVVARLHELIAAMGYDVESGDVAPEDDAPPERVEKRQRLLDQVANGELTATQAAQQLRSL